MGLHGCVFGRSAHADELDFVALFVFVESKDAVMGSAKFFDDAGVVGLA